MIHRCTSFWLRILLMVIVSLIFSLFRDTTCQAAEEPIVVKVGVYESNGFIALNENDEMTGYGATFMEALEEYANIRYEYIRLTWSQCMEALLNGDIDIVTDARRTSEREEDYDFSIQSIGQIQAAIFVPANRNDIYFNDYSAMSRLRVGFEKDALNLTRYKEFANQHGITVDTVTYPSIRELRAALENGEIDAFGGDTHMFTDDLKVISIYNTSPNYIMSKKGSPIMKRLNMAIEEMYTQNPDMIAEQYSYIVERQIYGNILLTRNEADYIKKNPVLRVATYPNRKPACWLDEETGTFKGIAIDMMEKLSENTGFQFEYIPVQEGGTANEMLSRGEADIAMPSIPLAYYEGEFPITVTKPLFTLSVALAFKDESRLAQDGDMTIAVSNSNVGIRTMLADYFKHADFQGYKTTQDCIEAVKKGDADAYGNAMYELEYQLKSPRNEKLRIAYSYSCPIDYCLAVRKDAPEELSHILNSGIALISQEEADRITRYHSTFLQYDKTLKDRLYENHMLLTGIGVLFIFLIVAWIWYSRIQKHALAAIALKNKEAERSAAEARQANAAKSDFLARMSHDMRTPMNGILGLVELHRDKEMPEEIRDALQKISSEGRFLLSLINDTLDMSKIENNQLSLNLQTADAETVIEEIKLLNFPTSITDGNA